MVVPTAVLTEMVHHNAPSQIQSWANNLPAWVTLETSSTASGSKLNGLGPGAKEAISIALELHADALLLDDRRGIREATRCGLSTITTLGVLEFASSQGLLNLASSFDELSNTIFYMPPPDMLQEILDRAALSRKTA